MANKVFIDNILDPATGDQGFFLHAVSGNDLDHSAFSLNSASHFPMKSRICVL